MTQAPRANDATRTLYRIHGWLGLWASLGLLVLCVSGSLAVFGREIDNWSNPGLRPPLTGAPRIGVDAALARFAAEGLLDRARTSYVGLPQPGINVYELAAPTRAEPRARFQLHVEGGPVLQARANHAYYWLRHLHVRFFVDGGRVVVGLFGVVMALCVVTGVLVHRHIVRDLLLMRWGRSVRALLSDLHKLLGVWAVLFHLMISLTGAWLGLEGYLTEAARALGRGTEAPSVEMAPAPHGHGPAASVDAMLREAESLLPGFVPNLLVLGPPVTHGPVTIYGNLPGTLIQEDIAYARFRDDGMLIGLRDPRGEGLVARIHAMMEPLHYGYFGGFWVKLLYVVLGLLPVVLTLTGVLIHLDRTRRLEPRKVAREAA